MSNINKLVSTGNVISAESSPTVNELVLQPDGEDMIRFVCIYNCHISMYYEDEGEGPNPLPSLQVNYVRDDVLVSSAGDQVALGTVVELCSVLVVRLETEDTTALNPVLQLTAVTVGLLVVHLQSRGLNTSLGVSNLRHRNHSTLERLVVESTEQLRVVQELPVVLVEGVAASGEALEAQAEQPCRRCSGRHRTDQEDQQWSA